MCRYSDHSYRTHFACLPCHHAVKSDRGGEPLCPNCRRVMTEMGRDFAAPRKASAAQWRKLEILIAEGVRFDSCGCSGPGPRPATLGEAKHPIMGPSPDRISLVGQASPRWVRPGPGWRKHKLVKAGVSRPR